MPKSKVVKNGGTTNQNKELLELKKELAKVKVDLAQIRLDIKAGTQSNTNAHKPLKLKNAQLVTKIKQLESTI